MNSPLLPVALTDTEKQNITLVIRWLAKNLRPDLYPKVETALDDEQKLRLTDVQNAINTLTTGLSDELLKEQQSFATQLEGVFPPFTKGNQVTRLGDEPTETKK